MKTKVRVWFLLPASVAAYFVISVGFRYLHEQFVIDRCLSSKHGSFDYSKMSCDVETNHPYISYQGRHPHDKQNFLLALVSFGACVLAYRYIRTVSDKT